MNPPKKPPVTRVPTADRGWMHRVGKLKDLIRLQDDIKRPSSSGGSLASIMWFLASICAVSDYIVAVVQTYVPMSQDIRAGLNICEHIFSIVFIFEILVKWKDGFKIFWRSWLNIAYFGMVLALLVGRRVTGNRYAVTFIIVLRTTHIFKYLPFRDDLVKVSRAVMRTLVDHRMIYLSFVVFTLAYAVCGVQMFNTSVPSAFGSIAAALHTLCTCMTQDGWGDIYRMFTEDMDADKFVVFIYFSVYVFVCIFMLQFIEYMLFQNLKQIMNPPKDVDDDSEVVKEDTKKTKRQRSFKKLTFKTHKELELIIADMKMKADETLHIKQELEKILTEVSEPAMTRMALEASTPDVSLQSLSDCIDTRDILTTLLELDQDHVSGSGVDLDIIM